MGLLAFENHLLLRNQFHRPGIYSFAIHFTNSQFGLCAGQQGRYHPKKKALMGYKFYPSMIKI